jgi:hypothetical protein
MTKISNLHLLQKVKVIRSEHYPWLNGLTVTVVGLSGLTKVGVDLEGFVAEAKVSVMTDDGNAYTMLDPGELEPVEHEEEATA